MKHLLAAACVCLVATTARADMVFFEQNTSFNPANLSYLPNLTEVGFAFTPSSTVDLSGFRTKFNTSDGRTVSFQLFAAMAGVPNTAVTLVNESFTAVGGGVLTGVDFTPFQLIGGMQYFAAVTNVGGLGVNFADNDDAVETPTGEVRFTLGTGVRFANSDPTPPETDQIFQFLTPAPVPEPSTTVLLALCGAVGGGISLRRRRAAAK